MAHILDNPAWNALNTGNAALAQGSERAKCFPADVAFFVGIPDGSAQSFDALYNVVPFEVAGFQTVHETAIPAPWRVMRAVKVSQFVYEGSDVEQNEMGVVPLSEKDVPQMLSLTKLTDPGPFLNRTIDLGHYFGIFDGDKLVAMAGQRMNPIPYAEISAVCTHPDYLGRGYASMLLKFQIRRIMAVGQIPFLHVLATNERAIKIYERLGFVLRKETTLYIIGK
ncbi:MAG TPA: GNAT family N-acetyltransferase [Puia sp.]|jgi:ribosomal protein S18 acetylase RimI-like enzyme